MIKSERVRIAFQFLLFITTFVTTTIAGAEWTYGKSVYIDFSWQDFLSGMHFSVPFLLILTVHEFGHYFTALAHKVKSSLPYYIPIPPIPFSIGTLGAVIRLRSRVPSTIQNFDIGIAGPLAGFVMALFVLLYGFLTLPPADYIFQIHPEYAEYGPNYADHVYTREAENILDVTIGKNLLFMFFESFVADAERIPNVHEMMHYPYLFAGFLALVFTSLNLLPIGQLDGGHVLYGLVGYKVHRMVASVFFIGFMFYAGLGSEYIHASKSLQELQWSIPLYVLFLYFCFTGLKMSTRDTLMYTVLVFAVQYMLSVVMPTVQGYSGWLLFGFVLGRFLGIQHPRTEIEEPLNTNRKILGWLAVLVFILCFTPNPIELSIR
jgi:membrane-associated protease RseP (regulator of RpoE activity)